MRRLSSWLRVSRFTFRSVFAYNGGVFIIALKALYFLFLIVFFYFNVVFTAIVSFLKVTFFGL